MCLQNRPLTKQMDAMKISNFGAALVALSRFALSLQLAASQFGVASTVTPENKHASIVIVQTKWRLHGKAMVTNQLSISKPSDEKQLLHIAWSDVLRFLYHDCLQKPGKLKFITTQLGIWKKQRMIPHNIGWNYDEFPIICLHNLISSTISGHIVDGRNPGPCNVFETL